MYHLLLARSLIDTVCIRDSRVHEVTSEKSRDPHFLLSLIDVSLNIFVSIRLWKDNSEIFPLGEQTIEFHYITSTDTTGNRPLHDLHRLYF